MTVTTVTATVPYSEVRRGFIIGTRWWRPEHRLRPVETPRRVKWVRPQLHVYRDRLYGSALWWSRCDECLRSHRRAYALSRTHAAALEVALRHARVTHRTVI